MNTFKKIVSVLFFIGSLGGFLRGEILPSLLLVVLGLILFPSISEKIKDSLIIWKKKAVRYVSYFLLLIIAGASIKKDNTGISSMSKITTSKENKTNSFQSYINKTNENTNRLSEDEKQSRADRISEIKQTETYKNLVENKIVSAEYLQMLTGINYALRATNKKNGKELFAIDGNIAERVRKSKNGEDKLNFMIKASVLSTPNKGGYTPELVEVFERYRKKYKSFGVPQKVYSTNGNYKEEIKHPYNLTSIIYHISSNLNNYNAIYEANNKGAGYWFKNSKTNYINKELATKKDYLQYAKQNYPDSPYIMKVDYEVSAYELYKAYNTNEISADDKYKNKKIAVTGVITDISEVMGQIAVDLKSGDGIGWTKIRCEVKDRKAVSKLRKGQRITMIGTCKGLTLNVSINIDNCKLWN